MSYDAKVQDGKLVIIVDVSDKAIAAATVSKSAVLKAIKEGRDPDKLIPSLIASTGGFSTVGNVRVSLNVTKL